MGRRSTAPGILVDQGQTVSPQSNRTIYITDVIYTGNLEAAFATNGADPTKIGPLTTQLTSVYNWHLATPVAAPDGFEVPRHHKVIYFVD
tara:strand:+ start:160 stop:429 length:270 start_codon:yes stop_codon:yes gene_type:complete